MSSNTFGQGFGGSVLESGNSAYGSQFLAASNTFGMKAFEDNFPEQFTPLSIDGCVVWFDAADTATIGASSPQNAIIKWDNKGSAAGYLEQDMITNTNVYTNTHTINNLNAVYFPALSVLFMLDLVLNFQARTIFVVSRHLTDMKTAPMPYVGYFNITDLPAGMNCGSVYDSMSDAFAYTICESGIRCGVVAAVGTDPFKQTNVLCWGQTDQNPPTDNVFTINGSSVVPLNEVWPAQFYPSEAGDYIVNSPTYGTAQDVGEILIYNRLLSPLERQIVQTYLLAKWKAE